MNDLVADEQIALLAIDDAIHRAGLLMDLDGAETDEERDLLYDERYHCGKCIVRTVLEEVWPAVDSYIDLLKKGNGSE